MDASIRPSAAFLLGHLRVPAESVPGEVWQEVFDSIVRGDAGKHLMFLNGSKPLKDHLYGRYVTDMANIPWAVGNSPERIGPTLHCFLVIDKCKPLSELFGDGFNDNCLFLTHHGEFFLWESTCDQATRVCLSARITHLGRDDMNDYWVAYGWGIFASLYTLTQADIKRREDSLVDARRFQEPILEVLRRF